MLYSYTELHVFHQANPTTRYNQQRNRRCYSTRLQSSQFTSRDSNRSFITRASSVNIIIPHLWH